MLFNYIYYSFRFKLIIILTRTKLTKVHALCCPSNLLIKTYLISLNVQITNESFFIIVVIFLELNEILSQEICLQSNQINHKEFMCTFIISVL